MRGKMNEKMNVVSINKDAKDRILVSYAKIEKVIGSVSRGAVKAASLPRV